MIVLRKVTVFVDGAGNPYRKASAAEAVSFDNAARGTVNDKAGFYLPTTLAEVAASAVEKESAASAE